MESGVPFFSSSVIYGSFCFVMGALFTPMASAFLFQRDSRFHVEIGMPLPVFGMFLAWAMVLACLQVTPT
jgi:hypothetical protein